MRILKALLALFALTACSDDFYDLDTEAAADAPFEWTRAEDVETRGAFLRNFGVGYSYNAVRGRYCDWRDIRCQVVDRQQVEEFQNNHEGTNLVSIAPMNNVYSHGKFSYSKRDYVANVSLYTHEAIDIGLYSSEKRKRSFFIEDGVQEVYFYTLDEEVQRAECNLAYSEFREQALMGNNRMLTLSFRNAIKHLSDVDIDGGDIFAAVDSFLNVWGTHVITRAYLGGRLRVDLMSDTYRFNDKARDDEWSTQQFLLAVQNKDEHRNGTDEFKWVEHGRLNIEAWGGDQSELTGLLGKHNTDGTRPFSTDGITTWRRSISYDPNDELGSNVELIDMEVRPIWEFAEANSPRVAKLIKSAVTQDAALQQKLLGEHNFFDTSFPIAYEQASCLYRKSTDQWERVTRHDSPDEPMVVNIVSGGRYVATVCHETIDGHSLWVCYPVYEGRVKMACGMGVDVEAGTAYDVRWIGERCSLTPLSEAVKPSGTFYINGGDIDVEPMDGLTYTEAHPMPAIELSGGIQPDGSYAAEAYNVVKQGTEFTLQAPEDLTNIVGFTHAGGGRYKRNAEYVYIYNQNEIKYE